jgi:hypothetical protein
VCFSSSVRAQVGVYSPFNPVIWRQAGGAQERVGYCALVQVDWIIYSHMDAEYGVILAGYSINHVDTAH